MNEDLFECGNISFWDAIEFLRQGRAMRRKNWNWKGMFIYLVGSNSYPAQTDIAKKTIGDFVDYQEYIAFKTQDGTVVPWVASQSDILSNDWQTVSKKIK